MSSISRTVNISIIESWVKKKKEASNVYVLIELNA